jgi:hypothetical protein
VDVRTMVAVDGIINGPCIVQTFFCLYWMCAVWRVETGDASWNVLLE